MDELHTLARGVAERFLASETSFNLAVSEGRLFEDVEQLALALLQAPAPDQAPETKTFALPDVSLASN